MRPKRAIATFPTLGAMTLMLLLSAACEPPLPTAEVQTLPTHTPTQLADTPMPTAPPPTPTMSEIKEKETAVTTPPTENAVIPEPDAEEPVATAKADLVQRLDAAEEGVTVTSIEKVQWRDTSLGCPQPGMVYAQVITPGYRIVLDVSGKMYEYHSDTQGHMVLCEPHQAGPAPGGESTETINSAKKDLAQRLGIAVDSIDTVAVIRQDFPADAFYCTTTKERIAKDDSRAVIMGESILLSAAGRTYEYHASEQTVIFCRQLP